MKLFSKRYTKNSLRFRYRRINYVSPLEKRSIEDTREILISEELRSRLSQELMYVISTGEFIERFVCAYDKSDNKFYLHSNTLKDLSERELGYDITIFFDLRNMLPIQTLSNYRDAFFFDLVEMLIIFSKKDKRAEFIDRLKTHFEEEDQNWIINGFMVVDKSETGIRALVPLIKDERLKDLLETHYRALSPEANYKILANTSADILQYIFSGETKRDTKNSSELLTKLISNKWAEKKYVPDLFQLLNDEVMSAKKFNNQISQLRHTDRYTIPIEKQSLFKLIMYKNITLVEIAIQSSPEKYILDEDPDILKNKYFKKYNQGKNTEWLIEKPISLDDLDFELDRHSI